jgi:molecular chaperone DnaJ
VNPFELLGIEPTADPDEIKRAFRRRAAQWHPDKNPGDPSAEERFQRLSEAYRQLLEQRHDHPERDPTNSTGPSGAEATEATDAERDEGHASTPPRAGGDPGLAHAVGTKMGRLLRKVSIRGLRRRGDDVRAELRIPFEEAATGSLRRITRPHKVTCSACDGRRAAPGHELVTCPVCEGSGSRHTGLLGMAKTCGSCGGSGQVPSRPCPRCEGSGRVIVEGEVTFRIPAGVDDGQRLVLAGWGEPGGGDAPAGDLRITVRVDPHPLLRRDGADLVCEVPVSVYQAAVGDRVEVPTLDGVTSVDLPAKSAPSGERGREIRIPGGGTPRNDSTERGDLVLRVVVELPHDPNEEQRAALHELERVTDDAAQPRRAAYRRAIESLKSR